jgi:YihY family inner membrane protein
VRRPWRPIALFWRKAYSDNLTGLSGMVAYNLMLSLLPATLVALWIAGRVIGSGELEERVISDLQHVFPSATESTLRSLTNRLRTSGTELGVAALVASVWIGSSFWGSLDTAFCRIYHMECRSWLAQKRFGLVMLVVALLLVVATLLIPAAQSLLVSSASDLPFGLSDIRETYYALSVAASLLVTFGLLCIVYWAVPNRRMPWSAIWPGAVGATLAMGVVDYAFPFYLSHVNTLATFGSTFVFVLIVLLWFYALAIIILGGAVINALVFELHDTGELRVANDSDPVPAPD